MRRIDHQPWAEIYCGLMTVEVDGRVLTFYNDCGTLDYCDSCYSPEGRAYIFDSLQSYNCDPVDLGACTASKNAHQCLVSSCSTRTRSRPTSVSEKI
ncbi:DUF7693 family protein [Pseudomonas asplenii]|uniref:DUF7693 family protein n=1 Tax=Pseudomonas asplenii TaxID=53407 RepID=UPI003B28564A